jgi:hypothetical protein
MQRLEAEGVRCAAIDLTLIGSENVTPTGWYMGVFYDLVRKFELSGKINRRAWWKERELLSPVQSLSEFFEDVLLAETYQSIVIFIDEVDSVLSLSFSTDDFFALIRACYNQRVDRSQYKRLTFCLLGVATPSDFIQDKNRTPFNIGRAVELCGFKFQEAQPLAMGLVSKASNPQAVLKEVLNWTGGQPFLTQKLCQIIFTSESAIAVGEEAEWVEKLVRSRIIENWESQDNPEHLRTIRDRIIWSKYKCQLLELHQYILQRGEMKANEKLEQMEWRLSGLVVKQQGKLRVYNPIYASVFNETWVHNALVEASLLPDLAQTLTSSHAEIQALDPTQFDDLKKLKSKEIEGLTSSIELTDEKYKQQRAYKILQESFTDWLVFEKQSYHLLSNEKVKLILNYIIPHPLSLNLLEYILCSISYIDDNKRIGIILIKNWIHEIKRIDLIRLFDILLENPDSRIRVGAIKLIQQSEEKDAINSLINRINNENKCEVKRAIIQCISHIGGHVPPETAQFLLDNEEDWLIKSYALNNLDSYTSALLIHDGTKFATDLGSIAKEVGFNLVGFTALDLLEKEIIKDEVLSCYKVIILVRGEHFGQYGNEQFYSILKNFVLQGGLLFATSWVGWESKYNEDFSSILPFTYIPSIINENIEITCSSTALDLAKRLFPNQISFRTSFEPLRSREGSVVLLETDNHIPIFGYRNFGLGCCYYLNTCQHSCLGRMLSPLQTSSELHDSLNKVFHLFFNSCKSN